MGLSSSIRTRFQHRLSRVRGGRGRATPPWIALAGFDLAGLSQFLVDSLSKSLRQDNLALVVRGPADDVFRVEAWRGYRSVDFSLVRFAPQSPLVRHLAAHPVLTHFSHLEKVPSLKTLAGPERDVLDSLHGGLLVPPEAAW